MVKLLHCADVHIDSPFAGCSPKEASERRAELISAFSKTVEYARGNGVRLFLIAGDLFDAPHVNYETVQRLSRELESYPECKFVIAPGNHDPYRAGGPYDEKFWPCNTYIFRSEELTKFSFDDLGCDVYGYAFTSDRKSQCPVEKDFVPDSPERINILLAHGDTEDPLTKYGYISKKLLDELPFDYVALGHVHKGNNSYVGEKYAYSGCLAGRALDETGKKGFIIGELSKEKRDMRFTSLSNRRYEVFTCDVTDLSDSSAIYEKVSELLQSCDSDTTVRILFTGELSQNVGHIKDIRFDRSGVEKLEIKDETVLEMKLEDFSDSHTVKGAVYEALKDKLQSADKGERALAVKALRYAARALSGSKDFN